MCEDHLQADAQIQRCAMALSISLREAMRCKRWLACSLTIMRRMAEAAWSPMLRARLIFSGVNGARLPPGFAQDQQTQRPVCAQQGTANSQRYQADRLSESSSLRKAYSGLLGQVPVWRVTGSFLSSTLDIRQSSDRLQFQRKSFSRTRT